MRGKRADRCIPGSSVRLCNIDVYAARWPFTANPFRPHRLGRASACAGVGHTPALDDEQAPGGSVIRLSLPRGCGTRCRGLRVPAGRRQSAALCEQRRRAASRGTASCPEPLRTVDFGFGAAGWCARRHAQQPSVSVPGPFRVGRGGGVRRGAAGGGRGPVGSRRRGASISPAGAGRAGPAGREGAARRGRSRARARRR
jgi:hypothetical protein